MGDKIVQMFPIEGTERGQVSGLYGLDATGCLWYGTLDDWNQADGGPGVIKWRRIQSSNV